MWANMPVTQQYWMALIWAVSATTSVGSNITTKSQLETIFSVIMILLGLIMYSVIIGRCGSLAAARGARLMPRRR
jgi:hypothetical protein